MNLYLKPAERRAFEMKHGRPPGPVATMQTMPEREEFIVSAMQSWGNTREHWNAKYDELLERVKSNG